MIPGTALDRDTIASIATAPGPAAIGIIRISGPLTKSVLTKIFFPDSGKAVALLPARLMTRGKIKDNEMKLVDDVLVCIYPAPQSYSGEDSVEIFGHGGIYNLQLILELVLKSGARQARAGEFSRRAFLNGKMDLTRVEAVNALSMAMDPLTHQSAVSQLGGIFFRSISDSKRRFIDVLTEIQARLEYPEDITDDMKRKKTLDFFNDEKRKTSLQLDHFEQFRMENEGVKIAIAGSTNTGKSSLLNCLIGKNRAIVTEEHGTTRDVVKETMRINGLMVEFYDTAGMMEKMGNEADRAAIGKTYECIRESDYVILLFDKSRKYGKSDINCLDFIKSSGKTFISVINKSDLEGPTGIGEVQKLVGAGLVMEISAKMGIHVEELKKHLADKFTPDAVRAEDHFIYSNRYKEIFRKLSEALDGAIHNFSDGEPMDKTAEDIRQMLGLFDELTGETVSEEVLDRIFSAFCLGK